MFAELEKREAKQKGELLLMSQKLNESRETITQRDGVIESLRKIIEQKKNDELSSPQSIKIMQLSKEIANLEAQVQFFIVISVL